MLVSRCLVVTPVTMGDHAKENSGARIQRLDLVRDHSYDDDDQLHHHHQHDGVPLSRRHSTILTHPISDPVNATSLVCGLLAGICQAGLFNPYDRALYLSVRDHRPFLHRKNFQNPYLGFSQSIGGRAIQGGLYFPMEHYFLRRLNANKIMYEQSSDPIHNFLAGTAAGALNACILNPLSAVKYKTWGRKENRGMVYEVGRMLRKSQSIRPFFNGLGPTLARDMAFGSCYTVMRLELQYWFDLDHKQQWVGNFCAAALATVISGPFNYVRNVQFATKSSEKADGILGILRDLGVSTSQQEGTLGKLKFLQHRLRIGWGTARVAMGMSFAHAVYDWLHENLGQSLRSVWSRRH